MPSIHQFRTPFHVNTAPILFGVQLSLIDLRYKIISQWRGGGRGVVSQPLGIISRQGVRVQPVKTKTEHAIIIQITEFTAQVFVSLKNTRNKRYQGEQIGCTTLNCFCLLDFSFFMIFQSSLKRTVTGLLDYTHNRSLRHPDFSSPSVKHKFVYFDNSEKMVHILHTTH